MIQTGAENAKQSVRRVRKSAMDDCKMIKGKDDQRRSEKQVLCSPCQPFLTHCISGIASGLHLALQIRCVQIAMLKSANVLQQIHGT